MTGQGAMSPFDIFQMSHYDEYMHQNSQSAFLPLGIINLRLLRVWSREYYILVRQYSVGCSRNGK